jgi:hypothetical protein
VERPTIAISGVRKQLFSRFFINFGWQRACSLKSRKDEKHWLLSAAQTVARSGTMAGIAEKRGLAHPSDGGHMSEQPPGAPGMGLRFSAPRF